MFKPAVYTLSLLSLAAVAHGADAPRGAGDAEARFKQYDTNHDGKLTLSEYVAGNTQGDNNTAAKREARFKAMDTNKDGTLSLDEYKAGRTAQGRDSQQRRNGNAQT